MDELRNNPQITELLQTLEENGLQKEKGEVSALVSYIGDMEHASGTKQRSLAIKEAISQTRGRKSCK